MGVGTHGVVSGVNKKKKDTDTDPSDVWLRSLSVIRSDGQSVMKRVRRRSRQKASNRTAAIFTGYDHELVITVIT